MKEMLPFRFRDIVLLCGILVVAAGLRFVYLRFAADNATTNGPLQVQDDRAAELKTLTDNLREHQAFKSIAPFATAEEVTAHTSPGYPWLLGWLAMVQTDVEPLVRWIQCGLGGLTAGLYFLFARRAFRSRVAAVLVGMLCAVYPFWIINTAEINDGVVVTFLLAVALYFGAKAGESGGIFASLLYGLSLAGLALVRAPLLPFACVGLLWFFVRCRKLSRGWIYAFLAFLGFANGLAPWVMRNVQTMHDIVPIVDSTYLHLWMGNNPKATGGPLDDATVVEALAEKRGQTKEAVVEQLGGMPQKDRYQSLAKDVMDEVTTHPLETMRHRIWAGLYFVFGQDWFTEQRFWRGDGSLSGLDAPEPPFRPYPLVWFVQEHAQILTGTILALFLLAFLGYRWSYGFRKMSMPAFLAMVWIPLPYLLGHAEHLSGPRLPLDGVLLCYAGFALACFVPGVGLFEGSDY